MSQKPSKTLPKKPSIVEGLTRFVDIRKIREELKKDPKLPEYKNEEIKVNGHVLPPLPEGPISGFHFPWALTFSFLLGALFPTVYFLSTQKTTTVVKVVEKEVKAREEVVMESAPENNQFHQDFGVDPSQPGVASDTPYNNYSPDIADPDETPDPHVDDSFRAPASEAGEEPQFDM